MAYAPLAEEDWGVGRAARTRHPPLLPTPPRDAVEHVQLPVEPLSWPWALERPVAAAPLPTEPAPLPLGAVQNSVGGLRRAGHRCSPGCCRCDCLPCAAVRRDVVSPGRTTRLAAPGTACPHAVTCGRGGGGTERGNVACACATAAACGVEPTPVHAESSVSMTTWWPISTQQPHHRVLLAGFDPGACDTGCVCVVSACC